MNRFNWKEEKSFGEWNQDFLLTKRFSKTPPVSTTSYLSRFVCSSKYKLYSVLRDKKMTLAYNTVNESSLHEKKTVTKGPDSTNSGHVPPLMKAEWSWILLQNNKRLPFLVGSLFDKQEPLSWFSSLFCVCQQESESRPEAQWPGILIRSPHTAVIIHVASCCASRSTRISEVV